MPATSAASFVAVCRRAVDGSEGRGDAVRPDANRALERRLRRGGRERRAVRKTDSVPEPQPGGAASVTERPFVGERGHELAVGVGRQERLEDRGEDLRLLHDVPHGGL